MQIPFRLQSLTMSPYDCLLTIVENQVCYSETST